MSISQTGYPKKIVLDDDTVIAINTYQVHQLNQLKIDRAECTEVKDSLLSRLNIYIQLKLAKDSVIFAQQQEIRAYGIAVVETQYVAVVNKARANKEEKRKKLFKFIALVEGIAVVILLIPLLL